MSFGSTQDMDKTASDLKRRVINFLSQKGVPSVQRLVIEVTKAGFMICPGNRTIVESEPATRAKTRFSGLIG